jgi:hypothetical protein
MTDITIEELSQIHLAAQAEAVAAAKKFFDERLGGVDQFACGFAWVNVPVKASTKLGRKLAELGFRKSYRGGLELWNPSGFACQNIDTLEQGATAYAEVFKKHGIECYAQSRLD